jgi:hypothetical protein
VEEDEGRVTGDDISLFLRSPMVTVGGDVTTTVSRSSSGAHHVVKPGTVGFCTADRASGRRMTSLTSHTLKGGNLFVSAF